MSEARKSGYSYKLEKAESEGASCSGESDPLRPRWTIPVHGALQARTLEWVAFPFSRGSFQPRDQTQVSHIVGELLTRWAKKQAQEYWRGYPGIKLGSPALQVDFILCQFGDKLSKYSIKNQDKLLTISVIKNCLLMVWYLLVNSRKC